MIVKSEFPLLAEKYVNQLQIFKDNRDKIRNFVDDNLKVDVDYGATSEGSTKMTLMKSGAEKIARLLDCKIILYPDFSTAKMLNIHGAVFLSSYLINQDILSQITEICMQKGFDNIEPIVKLYAWGEGKGAYELDEKCYQKTGKPLKGSANRAVKMAEKRARVDVIISAFGMDFTQDPEYNKFGRLDSDDSGLARGEKPEISEEEKRKFAANRAIMGFLSFIHAGESVFSKEMKADISKQVELLRKGQDAEDLENYQAEVKKMMDLNITEIDKIKGSNDGNKTASNQK